ncbi:MAG: hypothetical protein IT420_02075 [Candidatus Brocadia sp.]|nr:hypothetical protein [Candidatus Brocadia sp.]
MAGDKNLEIALSKPFWATKTGMETDHPHLLHSEHPKYLESKTRIAF